MATSGNAASKGTAGGLGVILLLLLLTLVRVRAFLTRNYHSPCASSPLEPHEGAIPTKPLAPRLRDISFSKGVWFSCPCELARSVSSAPPPLLHSLSFLPSGPPLLFYYASSPTAASRHGKNFGPVLMTVRPNRVTLARPARRWSRCRAPLSNPATLPPFPPRRRSRCIEATPPGTGQRRGRSDDELPATIACGRFTFRFR